MIKERKTFLFRDKSHNPSKSGERESKYLLPVSPFTFVFLNQSFLFLFSFCFLHFLKYSPCTAQFYLWFPAPSHFFHPIHEASLFRKGHSTCLILSVCLKPNEVNELDHMPNCFPESEPKFCLLFSTFSFFIVNVACFMGDLTTQVCNG